MNKLLITTALALAATNAVAQDFAPTRSITAFTQIEDEYYGDPFTINDLQTLETTLPGSWDESVEADTMFAGSETYADAGQWSWVDPLGGDFEAEGLAAGGLYNQYNGEMRAESLMQADFIVETSGSVSLYYDLWFGNSFGGLTGQARPGQSLAEMRIEDSLGTTLFAVSSSLEGGSLSGSVNVPLGPGQYRFTARAEITDETFFETVVGSMTVANFYVEGSISGGTPAPPDPPTPDTTPPAVPSGLTAGSGNGFVGLNWADNSESDLDGYLVYRSLASGGPYSAITGSPIGSSAFTDNAVSNGTTYYYVVTAVDLTGNESAQSSQVSATPTAPPPVMHVASITTSIIGPKKKRQGVATVQIMNDGGAAVSGALVSGTFSGDFTGSFSGTTDGAGQVTLVSGKRNIRRPDFTFCVDNVTHGSQVYDAGQNVETCESYP